MITAAPVTITAIGPRAREQKMIAIIAITAMILITTTTITAATTIAAIAITAIKQ